MKYLLFVFIISIISSCTKTDPAPELSDEIYKDLSQELEVATKGLEAEEKNLQKLLLEKEKAVPQTGQIKYALKKVNETESTIEKLKQQKQYFEIKLEIRKQETRNKYAESLKNGRPWPDPEELKIYRSTLKLQREKLAWDREKGMKKNVPRGTEKAEEVAPHAAKAEGH